MAGGYMQGTVRSQQETAAMEFSNMRENRAGQDIPPRMTQTQSVSEIIRILNQTYGALKHINERTNGPVPEAASNSCEAQKQPCLNELLETAIFLASGVSSLAEHLATQI